LEIEGLDNVDPLNVEIEDQWWISSAGEVQNPDFGYYGDNIRGSVRKLWLTRYDTSEYPLRAATLFDYENC